MTEPLVRNRNVCQIGIVVSDINRARERFTAVCGCAGSEILEVNVNGKAPAVYRGSEVPGRAKLAFFDMDNTVIEFIEPLDDRSTWAEFLAAHGNGIHHIAFKTRHAMDEHIAALQGAGYECVQQGGRYAYVDACADIGCILELLDYD